MARPRKRRRLSDAYVFSGFRPLSVVRGVFGDPKARVVHLVRRSKKRSAESAAQSTTLGTTALGGRCEIWELPITGSFSIWRFEGSGVGAAAR